MSGTNPLHDLEARERIDTDLSHRLFVEAGAGSGKTTHLVHRIVALLRAGAPIASIAAITFTEKAGAELRERTRAALQRELSAARPERPAWITQALEGLDAAPIGTIHSFAARLLGENPLEARLPPALELRDEMAARSAFRERWEAMRLALFDDHGPAAAVDTLLALGVRAGALEELARELDDAWDRVALWLREVDARSEARTGAGAGGGAGAEAAAIAPLQLRSVLDPLEGVRGIMQDPASAPHEDDKLVPDLHAKLALAEALAHAKERGDRAACLRLLAQIAADARTFGRSGAAKNWPSGNLKDVREALMSARDAALGLVGAEADDALTRVALFLARLIVDAAEDRRRRGTLEFHDLLIHARNLLVDEDGAGTERGEQRAAMHRRLRARYRHLLLDEFQDTDPLQAEIAVRLASPELTGLHGWESLTADEGRLFMVGDPKQSIYRFRRADISTYLLQQRLAGPDAQVELSTNFRSTRPVLDWINGVFGGLITEDGTRQPAYTPLDVDPNRRDWAHGPAVRVLGGPIEKPAEGKPKDPHREEALDIAATILEAVGRLAPHGGGGATPWIVQRGASSDPAQNYAERAARLSDIAILLPTRTGLPLLREVLDECRIAYSLESSSLVYSSQEIHDLLLALQAIANTSDAAALVFALRTPLFGCGDDDLLEYKAVGGSWSIRAGEPQLAEEDSERRAVQELALAGRSIGQWWSASPVARALASLRSMLDLFPEATPAQLLSALIEERRAMELAALDTHPEDTWRRMRFVVDQAAAWSEATGGSLREYLDWAASQADEQSRVVEAVVPETGAEAVRITTIHASKGRQFPIVIVGGAARGSRASSPRVLWPSHEDGTAGTAPELQLGSQLRTSGFTEASEAEKLFEEAEKVRLLYVACTRAESHLIVSLYAPVRRTVTNASRLDADHLPSRELATEYTRPGPLPQGQAGTTPVIGQLPEYRRWLELSAARGDAARRESMVAVTTLAKGVVPPAEPFPGALGEAGEAAWMLDESAPSTTGPAAADDGGADGAVYGTEEELPPHLALGSGGAHGTRAGLAVHRTMELLDLGSSPQHDVDSVSAAAARAFGLPDAAAVVARMARSALASEPVQRAAAREHWLELPMAREVDGVVQEGIADLVYREDNGSLTVADFKTDAGVSHDTLLAYRAQLTAYARMLEAATGQRVGALELLFTASTPARVIRLERR